MSPSKSQLKGLLKYHVAPRERQLKFVWQQNGKMLEPKLYIPEKLRGHEIIDPLHPPAPVKTKWISPTRHPTLEFLVDPPPREAHPCWQERPAFIIEPESKIHLGMAQACLLTNTEVVNDGFPESLFETAVKLTEEQHLMIRTLIEDSYALDPTRERLPRKIRYTLPWSMSIGDIGIPMKRKSLSLVDKLITYANSMVHRGTTPLNRRVCYGRRFFLNYPFGDDIVHMRRRCQALTLLDKPLKVGAAPTQSSTRYQFEDLKPMFPTIGLKPDNIYDVGYDCGLPTDRHLHTFFLVEEKEPLTEMPSEQFVPKMVIYAFAHAAAQALRKGLNWQEELADPIYVFGVGVVEEAFHFLLYEMNVLGPLGKLNRVWIDMDNLLMLNFPRMIGEVDRIIREANIDDYIMNKMEYHSETAEKLLSILNFSRQNA